MKLRNFLKPYFIFSIIVICQFIIYFLYAIGIIKSFRLNYIVTDVFSYSILIMFYMMQIMIFYIMCNSHNIKYQQKNFLHRKLICKNKGKIYIIIYLYMIIAIYKMLSLIQELLSNYGLIEIIQMSFTNRQKSMLVTGSGNTIFSMFLVASLLLLFLIRENKEKKWLITFAINFILLTIYSILLSARMFIIEAIIMIFLVFVRQNIYMIKLRKRLIRKICIVGIAMISFLLYIQSVRDYDYFGYAYTNSKLEWGITRAIDYFNSSTNYSLSAPIALHGYELDFPNGTLEILNYLFNFEGSTDIDMVEIRNVYGANEYTNTGSFFSIYKDMGYFSFVFIGVLSWVSAFIWKNYNRGTLLGVLFYPLIFYNIIESWRIFYLGTATAEFLFGILVFTYLIIKKDFSYKDTKGSFDNISSI